MQVINDPFDNVTPQSVLAFGVSTEHSPPVHRTPGSEIDWSQMDANQEDNQ